VIVAFVILLIFPQSVKAETVNPHPITFYKDIVEMIEKKTTPEIKSGSKTVDIFTYSEPLIIGSIGYFVKSIVLATDSNFTQNVATTAYFQGTYTFPAEGKYTLYVKGILDSYSPGYTGTDMVIVGSQSFTIDLSGPVSTVTIPAWISKSSYIVNLGGSITDQYTTVKSFGCTDKLSDVESYAKFPYESPSDFKINLTDKQYNSTDVNTIYCMGYDEMGNKSNMSTLTFRMDTIAPEIDKVTYAIDPTNPNIIKWKIDSVTEKETGVKEIQIAQNWEFVDNVRKYDSSYVNKYIETNLGDIGILYIRVIDNSGNISQMVGVPDTFEDDGCCLGYDPNSSESSITSSSRTSSTSTTISSGSLSSSESSAPTVAKGKVEKVNFNATETTVKPQNNSWILIIVGLIGATAITIKAILLYRLYKAKKLGSKKVIPTVNPVVQEKKLTR